MVTDSSGKGVEQIRWLHDRGATAACQCRDAWRRVILAAIINLLWRRRMSAEVDRKRLYWHSRRGMLELDVLLVPFLEEAYPSLDEEDKARYRRLLECEDQDMFGWFMQRGEPEDPDLRRIVRMILDRVQPN